MNVVHLVRTEDTETAAVLRALARQAEKGLLQGVVACVRSADGQDQIVLTGAYQRSLDAAASAGFRLQLRAIQPDVG